MENLDSTLDLMIDKVLAYDEIAFLDLVQFVWRRGWALETATDEQTTDPLRRALRACLVERMVEIWNAPPKNASEKAPTWCVDVPALQERFSVIKPEDQSFWDNEPENKIFAKRNIFAPKEFMFFL
ncbi:hypothetical protein TDB9533_02955 [Thalassocella blandensis]|nr:hypothetical protein TDB9533_02955 [Thalassocella blandensis]